jgi:hypothetical protein
MAVMVGCFYGQVLHKFKCHKYGHQHLPLLGSCQYADWPESLHRLLQLWAQHLQRCRCSNDLLNRVWNWVQQAIFPHVKLSCDLLWLHLYSGHLVRLDFTQFGLFCDFPLQEMWAFKQLTEISFQSNSITVSFLYQLWQWNICLALKMR